MFGSKLKARVAELEGALAAQLAVSSAVDRSTAVVELSLDGVVLAANGNFCTLVGFGREELVGQKHAALCDPDYVRSDGYRRFWDDLRAGKFFQGQFKRRHSSGRTIWLEATYNPVTDPATGKVTKIIKFASDITGRVEEAARTTALVDAIERSMAVIEFAPDGTVLRANDNFLAVMGYSAREVVGRHHRMFCAADLASSTEYSRFWESMRAGRFVSGQFCRVNKRGEKVWLEASYNPVLDSDGRVERVVKTASDVTAQVLRHQAERESAAIAADAAQKTARISGEGETIILETVSKIQTIASAVDRAAADVAALGTRTTEISSITKTIKEIADQTNLLALNAAIEAARAGESGRGFAVVADEVRKLAERTAKSTAEITRMVGTIQAESQVVTANMNAGLDEVTEGVSLARSAGEVIRRIREDASRVVEVVQQISDQVALGRP